jgi:alpha-glucosidase (family GH31 glycosyl hydrolase)
MRFIVVCWGLVGLTGCAAEAPLSSWEVREGETTVTVHSSPFALTVSRSGQSVGATRIGTGACAPLALALRRPGDDPRRFHAPEDPTDDLNWLRSGDATLLAREPLTLEVALRGDQGESEKAQVTVRAGGDGFVDVAVEFVAPDATIALVNTCWQAADHTVGGGEVFEGADLTGRTIPLYFAAPRNYASSTNEKHAPVPFVATDAGLAIFVETERVGAIDASATDPEALQLRFQGGQLPLRLRAGGIVDNAAAHARRMGLPPMPPRWVLTPQLWRNELAVTVEGDQVVRDGRARLLDDAHRLRSLGIPGSVLWIDAPWATGHNTFAFNEIQFPDPAGMLAELRALGFHSIVWATEYVNSSNDEEQQVGMPPYASRDLFEAFNDAGYLVGTRSGAPLQLPWGRGFGAFVDFTDEQASAAFKGLIEPILAMGVRGFKLDFCESMRADLLGISHNDIPLFSDGSHADVQHTRYARLFHQVMIDALREKHPDDWFVIARTGGIFDQANGVALWPGDLDNDLQESGVADEDGVLSVGGLPAAVSGALSASLSGYPLFGSDIGGYLGGPPTTEVLLRWAQFGALSTVMQLGGGGTGDATHNPWDDRYDTDLSIPVYRKYARLHMQLLPTLEAMMKRATTRGIAPLVPVGVVAGTAAAWADRYTYLFGDNLLVAPVVDGGVQRTLAVPAGRWLSWWDGAVIEGPGTVTVEAPLEELPLFWRAGAPIALAHPELMTVLPSERPEIAGPTQVGDGWQIRVAAGPPTTTTLADDTRVEQRSDATTMTVKITQPQARRVVVEAVLQSDVGPREGAGVRVGAIEVTTVAESLEALFHCSEHCLLRTPLRTYVSLAAADQMVVLFD